MKFISGLSELESGYSWKKRQHKKYSGNIGYVRRNIQFLKTWDGYITAAKKLNTVLRPQGIDGASHSPDEWYPCLWMLGGPIVE